jgi:2,3-bisphosphoglycerate-dependent phosphoglycerate mutase
MAIFRTGAHNVARNIQRRSYRKCVASRNVEEKALVRLRLAAKRPRGRSPDKGGRFSDFDSELALAGEHCYLPRMTILLVRHGETDGNAARVLQRPDVPLNDRGMQQAEQLARRLFSEGFVHIVCSDLLRARMTAVPLAARSGIAIEESPLLQERNFGDLRGTPYEALAEDPFGPDFAPPNGEDWPTFHARVADAFAFVVSKRRSVKGPLVVVTHGLVCRAVVERHAMLSDGIVAPERFDNASVTVLHENAPHTASLVNCTRHLMKPLETNGKSGLA